jgi:hypothetical protein
MAGLLAGNNITGRLRHYRQAATAAKCWLLCALELTDTWLLHAQPQPWLFKLRVLENGTFWGILGQRDKVTGECRKLHTEELIDLCC